MTEFLTAQQVVKFHDMIVPSQPLIAPGKLEAAVGRPQATFAGVYLHASLFEQAAALLEGLVDAHAFLDGNKRTAWISTYIFLDINDVKLKHLSDEVVADFVEEVSLGMHTLADIAMWLAACDVDNMRLI